LVSPELDVLFRPAERLERESDWFGHVPFAHWLVGVTRPRIFVEIGTNAGVSYAAFCQAVVAEGLATRCYAVDTWKDDQRAGSDLDEVFADLAAYHDSRFAGLSQMLRCASEEACGMFRDCSIDLLHIDEGKTCEAVKRNFERWLPKLSERGVVLFNGISERSADCGVQRLWEVISRNRPSFEFAHGNGLGVLCVGTEVPDELHTLCSMPERVAATIRSRFARLGERWDFESRTIRLGQETAMCATRIALLRVAAQAGQAKAEQTERLSELNTKAGRAAFARWRTAETIAAALRTELEGLKLQAGRDLLLRAHHFGN
jgi:hypothetical protein